MTQETKIIRYGIAGPGEIAKRFARVLQTVDGAELVAVASSDQGRADDFAKEFNVAKSYEGYEALVEDDSVDAVYIGLIHNKHFEVARMCLNHGKAVICEKPLVLTEREAVYLSELAHEKNVLLMEAMWSRCIPTFLKAKEWIAEGKIGDVKLVQASFCFNFPYTPEHRLYNPELAGGSLYDAGVYPIEFTTGILGENPISVTGKAHFSPTGVDDFVSMSMAFESGALASLSCGITAYTNQDGVIYGSDGRVIVYGFLGSKKCQRFDNEGKLMETFEVEYEDGFIYQIQHFNELFRAGSIESPIIPHKDNIATSAIFETLMNDFK